MYRLGIPTRGSARTINRREAIRIGALGVGGLTLPNLLRGQESSSAMVAPKAKSAIILFLSGGPAQMDMWDPKPDAPEEVRGTFAPIQTRVPGVLLGEHLPRMARLADKFSILRAVRHKQSNHPAAAYWMMIGAPIARPIPDAGFMSRVDRPHPGSVIAKLLSGNPGMPPFVLLPEAIQPNGPERSGQHAGFLGAEFDPYRINSDPNSPDYSPGAVALPAHLGADRFTHRRALRARLASTTTAESGSVLTGMDAYYERAFDLLSSTAAQRAFDITAEPAATRDRYGRHVFGQSVLLARRMVEAGARLVQVNWVRHDGGKGGQGYDSHRDHLNWARTELLPPTDAAFSSLIEDLDARGLLDETLVIMMGEFGRTPRFNSAGGRDHWPYCFSVVMAGGGIRGGHVLGASDKIAAYPAADPVSPADIIATLHHCFGLNSRSLIHDFQDRPYVLAEGEPLLRLM